MSMFNKSKKKLQAVEALIDTTQRDINQKENDLTRVAGDIERFDLERQQLQESVDKERKEQDEVQAENARITREINEASAETARLKDRIAKAKAAAEEARTDKERLTGELARHEEMVREEHRAAEAAAEAARKEAARLLVEQEKERQNWHEVKNTHEDLRRQVEDGVLRCAQAKVQRDQAKSDWAIARDELRELQLAHRQLKQDNERTEEQMQEQIAQKKRLEEELKSSEEQHRKVAAAQKTLETEHKQRQFVLESMSENLTDKRGQLQRELGEFQDQFERAKAVRERYTSEQNQMRETTNTFLPEHFQLQTEHAARGRELEQVRRERELLNWEHYKVNRDLNMLAKSYHPGGTLPPVAHTPSVPLGPVSASLGVQR